jgi:hypothetical protein
MKRTLILTILPFGPIGGGHTYDRSNPLIPGTKKEIGPVTARPCAVQVKNS